MAAYTPSAARAEQALCQPHGELTQTRRVGLPHVEEAGAQPLCRWAPTRGEVPLKLMWSRIATIFQRNTTDRSRPGPRWLMIAV